MERRARWGANGAGSVTAGVIVVLASLWVVGPFSGPSETQRLGLAYSSPAVRTHASAAFAGAAGGKVPGIRASNGDALFVFVAQSGKNGTPRVNDSAGDLYTQLGRASKGSAVTTTLFLAGNVTAASALTVWVNFSSAQTFAVAVVDVGGVQSSPVDAVGAATYGAQGTAAQPKVSTSVVGDLVLGVIGTDENSSVAGSQGSTSVNSSTAVSGSSVITLGIVEQTDSGVGSFTIWGAMGPATSVLSLSYALALRSTSQTASTYRVSFGAVGLPSGTNWSVTLGGTRGSATSPSRVAFSVLNGTYSYTVGSVSGYLASPASGSVRVAGGNVSAGNITFTSRTSHGPHPIDHVVVIVLENANASAVTATSAPYATYLASKYAFATHYYAMCHPSRPNYIGLGSGYDNCVLGSAPTGEGNLGDLFERNNLSWQDYSESLPANCTTTSSGLYDADHNPFAWFSDISQNKTRCNAHLVGSSVFNASVASGSLGNYSFYTPNLDDDGHNTWVAFADAWLKGFLGPILNGTGVYNSAAERALVAHTAFFVTWDEANGTGFQGYSADGLTSSYCVTQASVSLSVCGGPVDLIAVSPYSLARTVPANATHFDLVSTIEWLFSLPGDGGWDGTQYFPALTDLFSFAANGFLHST
ncbi:MAG TPA: alkaline phosphatase family protein [Thermoplasmata archaeon]|nr:alkaline phosphatase family protein [Thermoplasmata archaeon]